MKKILCLPLALFLLIGCAPEPQWYGILRIQNCTENIIHVTTNVESCDPNLIDGFPGTEFDILPGRLIQIAQTEVYSDESLVTVELFVKNIKDAFVTVSLTDDDVLLSRTWTYLGRKEGNKQLFNLEDNSCWEGKDIRKRFTTIYYSFEIHNDDLKE